MGQIHVAARVSFPLPVTVLDKAGDGAFEVPRQIVVFEQDPALQREVPALDLALCHRMIGLAPGMAHALILKPVGEIVGDVGRAIVGEQPWPSIGAEPIEP